MTINFAAITIFAGILMIYYYVSIRRTGRYKILQHPFFSTCVLSLVLNLSLIISITVENMDFEGELFRTIRVIISCISLVVLLILVLLSRRYK